MRCINVMMILNRQTVYKYKERERCVLKRVTFNEERCKGCMLCIGVCPKKIIEIDTGTINKKGFNPASIKPDGECIGCMSCVTICPDVAITIEEV